MGPLSALYQLFGPACVLLVEHSALHLAASPKHCARYVYRTVTLLAVFWLLIMLIVAFDSGPKVTWRGSAYPGLESIQIRHLRDS